MRLTRLLVDRVHVRFDRRDERIHLTREMVLARTDDDREVDIVPRADECARATDRARE
jgi:hypothetical protein